MADDWAGFLTRDDVLGGMPARRASTLLFAIESRTAQLVVRSRRALASYLTERTAEQEERAFLEALGEGRDLPLQPTIQDLERYAPDWAPLVPAEAAVRAALARMLGAKYILPAGRTPAIAAALGLDDPVVGERFQALHGVPITSMYTQALPTRERWRWIRAEVSARLERLPPFWTAFALTLTEAVGGGVLALPIAFAAVGPVAAVVVLVVLGLVNILTIAAMAEAVARSGGVRYRGAYFGGMVRDYLGPIGARILTAVLLLLLVAIQVAAFVGLATTLADALGLPAALWAAAHGLALVLFLRRDSLGATVASAFVVGGTTIALMVTLSVLSLPHITGDNLRHAEIPFRDGRPFDSSVLELIFGVVLLTFLGHTSTVYSASVVLAREPSGRSLIRGSAAGLGVALGLYCLWIIAANGAIPAAELAGERGTALIPLAEEVGPHVDVLGVIFVVLAMGMASVHIALGLSYQIREWLPSTRPAWLAWAGEAWGVVVGMAPTLLLLAVVELLFLTDRESFSAPLGFVGTVTTPIVAGVFSMLLLAASRRNGDLSVEGGWRATGSPVVVAGVCTLFLAGVVIHGIFVWDQVFWRSTALLVALGITAFAISVWRTATVPRLVIDVRVDEGSGANPATVDVVARGETVQAEVIWSPLEPGVGRTAQVALPALAVEHLKIWVHRQTPEGRWEGVPARVTVDDGAGRQEVALDPTTGEGRSSTHGQQGSLVTIGLPATMDSRRRR